MSIISGVFVDDSDVLAKRFAAIALTYFNQAAAVREGASRVPLENLYRLLQMYRYNSYSDEPANGVLALEDDADRSQAFLESGPWQNAISAALGTSLHDTFQGVDPNDAIDQLQSSLRAVARGEAILDESSRQARAFFQRFCDLV
jgi:hypothetical protein